MENKAKTQNVDSNKFIETWSMSIWPWWKRGCVKFCHAFGLILALHSNVHRNLNECNGSSVIWSIHLNYWNPFKMKDNYIILLSSNEIIVLTAFPLVAYGQKQGCSIPSNDKLITKYMHIFYNHASLGTTYKKMWNFKKKRAHLNRVWSWK